MKKQILPTKDDMLREELEFTKKMKNLKTPKDEIIAWQMGWRAGFMYSQTSKE